MFILALSGHTKCGKTCTLNYLMGLFEPQITHPRNPHHPDQNETFIIDGLSIRKS